MGARFQCKRLDMRRDLGNYGGEADPGQRLRSGAKRGDKAGLDTMVVHARKRCRLCCISYEDGFGAKRYTNGPQGSTADKDKIQNE